jgi:periplasmic divalent cation tolerance protein
MNTIKIIYITAPSRQEAEKIACHLLEKKLIACANFHPIGSVYWWQGSLTQDNEYILMAKTSEEHFDLVKQEVEKIHSYAVPCIVGVSSHVSENYYNFVKNTVSSVTE